MTFHESLRIFNSLEVHPVSEELPENTILEAMLSIAQATGRPVGYRKGKLAVGPNTKLNLERRGDAPLATSVLP